MKLHTSLATLALLCATGLHAQDDITPYYMTNGDFDLYCNYDATQATNVKGDVVNDVYGWTNTSTTATTVAGTFEWNGLAKFNTSSAIPEAGFDGQPGGGLALSTGMGGTLSYTQEVTLTKGHYRLATAAYNAGTSKLGTLTISWTPNGGTAEAVEQTDLALKQWTEGALDFTLTAKKTGTITVSFKAPAGKASTACAKMIVDYVHLLAVDVDLTAPLTTLKSAISSATTQYGDGTNVGAEALKQSIDHAQAVCDDPDHTLLQVLAATAQVKQATMNNKLDNASADKPLTLTSTLLTNPSFESGFTGWRNEGMNTQSNTTFSRKTGTYYVEKWVSGGGQLGDCSLTQTLYALPAGHYRLTAAALHIQQGTNATVNKGEPQTGATLYAGTYATDVTAMANYTLDFLVLDGRIDIGFRCHNATGNWACVDNFRLSYTGRLTTADLGLAVQDRIDYLNARVLSQPMQDKAREAMAEVIAAAQAVMANPTAEAVDEVLNQLNEAEAACQESIALYEALADAIAQAEKVADWIADVPSRHAKLETAIATAQAKYADYTLSATSLRSAASTVLKAAKSNDRQHYQCSWSLGNTSDPNNAWCEDRSIESKNWVLYWEKGHGDAVPAAALAAIEHAQIAFDFYTDSLHYINRATSKTNTYKMIIKLRYSDDWEATGSGVDNQIGLLTLTPWAQSSRNWQTLYHEVGHCFQYQTHCDNGDWNGWMYTVGPNGTAWWEQCAQWQAYKIMPYDQFTNEWYWGYLTNTHKHVLHEAPRYNGYFIQDYWTMRHGWDMLGRLWNGCRNPEDACEAYQRITGITNSEFNDEMWDCAARFATWDIPHLEKYHQNKWQDRPQPSLTKDNDGYWVISPDNAPENTGHNIIQLNTPAKAKQVTACFEGLAGDSRYRQNYLKEAGWRYGFVALLKNGTRVYGPMGSKASYTEPCDTVRFDVPAGCQRLWFVVSGAAKTYHMHGWDDNDSNDEQYGYRVKFDNTNLMGNTDNHITAIDEVEADAVQQGVFTLTGVRVRNDNSTHGLPAGIYIVGGRRVMVK